MTTGSCGNVGKLTRIADVISQASFATDCPRRNAHAPFMVLGGFIDFLIPSTFANGNGAITGLANIAPVSSSTMLSLWQGFLWFTIASQHSIFRLFQLTEAARKDLSLLPEAQRLQGIIARGDHTIAKAGVAGSKYLIERVYGYGGLPRRPLLPVPPATAKALWEHSHVQDLVKLEWELRGKVSN